MATSSDYNLTVQVTKEGFGSYLDGILPEDVAIACGAFSQSVRQVRNIDRVPIEKFAQVVVNLETMKDLNVNGSDVPVDTPTATSSPPFIALGSGPQGSYTMSDMFGAMSGLPYIAHYQKIQSLLQNVATQNLFNIYRNMYLAVTWDVATATPNYTTTAVENPVGSGNYDYFYTITGVSVTAPGGGFTRDNVPPPIVTISSGPVQLTAIVDTNDNNTPASFGRIVSISLVGSGGPIYYGSGASPITPNPGLTVTIQNPPDNGTGGWPGMNSVVQTYIDSANAEIININTLSPDLVKQLNAEWNAIGLQLKREQRARSIGFYPLPDPKDPFEPLCLYPTTQYSFVDNLGIYGANTLPHMYSQTIEAIVDWGTVGGRSTVGVMREQRNQARLTEIGVPLDNNIVGHLDQSINNAVTKSLISNGNLNNLGVDAIGETVITNPDQTAALYTSAGTTKPIGYYDAATDDYVVTNLDYVVDTNNTTTNGKSNTTTLQTGRQIVPGSLAGSPYQNLIPPELNVAYLSGQLMPGTYTVAEAVQEVIDCNCDCWENP